MNIADFQEVLLWHDLYTSTQSWGLECVPVMFNATGRVVWRKIIGQHYAQELQAYRVVFAVGVRSRVVTKY